MRIGREVAGALAYAHERGIVHRDIKPENILFSGGHAVVADFGIARAIDRASEKITQQGTITGTPAYMSPEQARDRAFDGRSDVYSLACVLYEAIAGVPPFPGDTPQQQLSARLTKMPPLLHEYRHDVPVADRVGDRQGAGDVARRPLPRRADVQRGALVGDRQFRGDAHGARGTARVGRSPVGVRGWRGARGPRRRVDAAGARSDRAAHRARGLRAVRRRPLPVRGERTPQPGGGPRGWGRVRGAQAMGRTQARERCQRAGRGARPWRRRCAVVGGGHAHRAVRARGSRRVGARARRARLGRRARGTVRRTQRREPARGDADRSAGRGRAATRGLSHPRGRPAARAARRRRLVDGGPRHDVVRGVADVPAWRARGRTVGGGARDPDSGQRRRDRPLISAGEPLAGAGEVVAAAPREGVDDRVHRRRQGPVGARRARAAARRCAGCHVARRLPRGVPELRGAARSRHARRDGLARAGVVPGVRPRSGACADLAVGLGIPR